MRHWKKLTTIALAVISLATPLSVLANEQLALALSRPGGSTFPDWVIWAYAAEPGEGVDYPGGQGYYQSPSGQTWIAEAQDHRFQTFVAATPEPAPLALLVIGLVVVGIRRSAA